MFFQKKIEKHNELEKKLKKVKKDLIELKVVTNELISTRKLLEQLTNNCPDMIWAKDKEGKYIFANIALCKNFYKCNNTDDLIGKTDCDLEAELKQKYPDKRFDFAGIGCSTDASVLQTNSTGFFLQEGYMYGEYIALLTHKSPLYDDNNNIIGIVGIARIYTEYVFLFKKIKENLDKIKDIPEAQDTINELVNFIKNIYFLGACNQNKYGCWVFDLVA